MPSSDMYDPRSGVYRGDLSMFFFHIGFFLSLPLSLKAVKKYPYMRSRRRRRRGVEGGEVERIGRGRGRGRRKAWSITCNRVIWLVRLLP